MAGRASLCLGVTSQRHVSKPHVGAGNRVHFSSSRALRAVDSKNMKYIPIESSLLPENGQGKRCAVIPSATTGGTENGTVGTVAVAGATGLIGSRLIEMLVEHGYRVNVLTRNPSAAKAKLETLAGVSASSVAIAGPTQWKSAIKGCKAVINMAGEPIATRWSAELKQEIKRSRVSTTKRIAEAINALDKGERPEVLVNASAVGFYGTSETATFNESSASGDDYLAEVCREWEAAANEADCRVVVLRTGIVLAKEGGALAKMVPVFEIFAGGPLGSGRQWFSWIHRDDVCGLIIRGVQNKSMNGAYNCTAPNPVRMGELCSALGDVMQRPSFVPVPDFALNVLLGEGAQVVLEGQRVLPTKALEDGYEFKYSKVGDALRNIVRP
jgi:uncharacterized protein (TIGR01777 family)